MDFSSLRSSLPSSSTSSTLSSLSWASSNREKLQGLEMRLQEKVIGQELAVKKVSRRVQIVLTGFHDARIPYGVFLFVGPTGTGKTELAKSLAEELSVPLHRFDMAEFEESHTASTLLGAPPGYAGSEKEGALIAVLKEDPVFVVLFDEIEKAHPSLFPIFLL